MFNYLLYHLPPIIYYRITCSYIHLNTTFVIEWRKEIAYWIGVRGTFCLRSPLEDPWPFPERAHSQAQEACESCNLWERRTSVLSERISYSFVKALNTGMYIRVTHKAERGIAGRGWGC